MLCFLSCTADSKLVFYSFKSNRDLFSVHNQEKKSEHLSRKQNITSYDS